MIGTTIQHYNILEKIGHGGMGVVYKAYDTRLERTVALKFLPEDLATDGADRIRFLREARAASAINHPNVCTIYDLKEHEAEQFIVMEYIEGETLKKLAVNNIQLPVEKIVDYAIQICQALMATHARGILHRDIKSENIMVTPSGQVKVMDFGLALVKGSQRLTQSSSTLGTIAYMSPEQIEGRPVDARSDIFSFGVVLYELLTGRLPFTGETQAAVIYAILNNPPSPVETWREVPPGLSALLFRTLEKPVEKRSPSFQEVRNELVRIKAGHTKTKTSRKTEQNPAPPRRRVSPQAGQAIAGVALFMMLFVTVISLSKFVKDKPEKPMNIVPFATDFGLSDGPSFSPDAKQVAYHWQPDTSQSSDIYIQQIGTNQKLQITSNRYDDVWPAWSPDGQYIAFCRQTGNANEMGVYIISSLGGNERRVYKAICQHPSWSPDGKSIVFVEWERGVILLEWATGKERILSRPKTILTGTWVAANPKFSPDGKSIAYVRIDTYGIGELYVIDLDDESPRKITNDNTMITGLSWMPDGKTLIFSSARATSQKLWSIHRNGNHLRLLDAGGQNSISPSVSQDGRCLAFVEQRADNYQIGRIRINRKPILQNPEKVIATQRDATFLNISPDGKTFTFNSNRTGYFEIWRCDSSGNNQQQLTYLKTHSGSPQWSPDGNKIAFDTRPYGNSDIFVVSRDGGAPMRITYDSRDESIPTWSCDGAWIYYAVMDQQESQVWKVSSNGGTPVRVTHTSGMQVLESPDGRVLYLSKQDAAYVWQCDRDGNNEKKLFQAIGCGWREWTIKNEGIYFLCRTTEDNYVHARLYNFQTGRIEELALLPILPDLFNPMPSFDRKWLYVSYKKDLTQSEIILVEYFQ